MAYIGLPPKANFTSGLLDRFTSTTGTTVTLTHDISSENDIVVFVNFVKQDSTTYSVGGTGNKTLTLGGTLVSSDIVEVHYLNIVGQTVNPSANSVGSSQSTADSITGQTAETSIATDDTVLIHDTSAGALRKMTRANFVSGVGGDNTPAFSARVGSNQSLSDNIDTKVNFDTEDFDTDSAFDTTNKRFTVPSGEGGKYFFYARGRFLQTNMSQYVIAFRVNGSEVAKKYIYSGGLSTYIYNAIQYRSYDISAIETLSAGDYIEVYVKGDNVDGNTVTFENGTVQSEFSGFKLIGV